MGSTRSSSALETRIVNRGFLGKRLINSLGFHWGNIAQAALFGGLHLWIVKLLDPEAVAATFIVAGLTTTILAWVAGWAMEKRGGYLPKAQHSPHHAGRDDCAPLLTCKDCSDKVKYLGKKHLAGSGYSQLGNLTPAAATTICRIFVGRCLLLPPPRCGQQHRTKKPTRPVTFEFMARELADKAPEVAAMLEPMARRAAEGSES